jgi:hypothetical protein
LQPSINLLVHTLFTGAAVLELACILNVGGTMRLELNLRRASINDLSFNKQKSSLCDCLTHHAYHFS